MFCMLKKKYIMLMFQNITQIMKNKLFFFTTCESLHELEADHRGGSRTAKTSGTELLVEIVNSFYQWMDIYIIKDYNKLIVQDLWQAHHKSFQ